TTTGPLVGTASVLGVNGFDGMIASQAGGSRPPDSDGAVGPSSFIEEINTAIAIYDKSTGALLPGGTITNTFTFFSSLSPVSSAGDPVVVYNELTGRFGVGAEDFSANKFYFAISKTSNPTVSQSDWNFFSYNLDDSSPGIDGGDYPKIGYNADGFVV